MGKERAGFFSSSQFLVNLTSRIISMKAFLSKWKEAVITPKEIGLRYMQILPVFFSIGPTLSQKKRKEISANLFNPRYEFFSFADFH